MQVSLDGFGEGGLDRLAAAFDTEHRRLFTFTMEAEHEFVNLRVIAFGGVAEIPAQPIEEGNGNPRAAWVRDHQIWVDGSHKNGAIYERAKLRAGDRLEGPAIVLEMDSTTLVLPGCAAVVDRFGNILINPVSTEA
jgi:N-methylhydantoinase A